MEKLREKTELAMKIEKLLTPGSFENWNIKKMNSSECAGGSIFKAC